MLCSVHFPHTSQAAITPPIKTSPAAAPTRPIITGSSSHEHNQQQRSSDSRTEQPREVTIAAATNEPGQHNATIHEATAAAAAANIEPSHSKPCESAPTTRAH
ncbi:hypothetical protein AB3S75_000267 [Citrus x aurantiifolia]